MKPSLFTNCHSTRSNEPLGRRAFIRAALIAGLGWLAAVLLRRSCTNKGVCGSCPTYAGCNLPWRKEAGS